MHFASRLGFHDWVLTLFACVLFALFISALVADPVKKGLLPVVENSLACASDNARPALVAAIKESLEDLRFLCSATSNWRDACLYAKKLLQENSDLQHTCAKLVNDAQYRCAFHAAMAKLVD